MAAHEQEYDPAYEAALAEGRTSVPAEMAAEEVRVLDEILHRVAVERETLRIEWKAEPR